MTTAALPQWAIRAITTYQPLPAYGLGEPDAHVLKRWQEIKSRLNNRWKEVRSDKWKVPNEHEGYAYLLRETIHPPGESIRQAILEDAIECSWEFATGKHPEKVIEAVKELDSLNHKISEAAGTLAHLFRQRNMLKEQYSLSDLSIGEETYSADAFRLFDALELTFQKSHSFAHVAFEEIQALLTIARQTSQTTPELEHFMDVLADRLPRIARPDDAGDLAMTGNQTNYTVWSQVATRFILRLQELRWAGLPQNFLLSCLTNQQIADLLTVTLNADEGAYSSDGIRKLRKRLAQNNFE